MKKILFISHDASRTGAPIVLLTFLEWLKQQGKYELTLFLKHGGEIESRFQNITSTYLPAQKTLSQRIVKRVLKKSNEEENVLPQALLGQHFDLVYLNTVVCLDLAPAVKSAFKCPVICHVHENEFTIRNYYPAFVTADNLQAVDHFISVSQSTQNNLAANYGVSSGKITRISPFVRLSNITMPSVTADAARQELGLTDEIIIGGSGITIWRKGVDLFMQLAVELDKLMPGNNIKLLWVGALTHEFSCQYAYEAERLGIRDKIIFTGNKAAPQNYFQLFDVFTLTSREDPFPLVAIEAASFNKPVVCFEQAGGMPEFVNDGENGYVIPYGDVNAMAVKLLELMDNNNLRLKMGKQAGKLIAAFDVEIAAPKIVRVIEQLITNI
jgi:glycosyltransferase involved in cell wall biosynthesis